MVEEERFIFGCAVFCHEKGDDIVWAISNLILILSAIVFCKLYFLEKCESANLYRDIRAIASNFYRQCSAQVILEEDGCYQQHVIKITIFCLRFFPWGMYDNEGVLLPFLCL